MSTEQQRTDATSRERSPDHEYVLSVDQAAELYAKAGHPRTPRAIQKYCALTKLDCHKVETETGEKYLVAPYSGYGRPIQSDVSFTKDHQEALGTRDRARRVSRPVSTGARTRNAAGAAHGPGCRGRLPEGRGRGQESRSDFGDDRPERAEGQVVGRYRPVHARYRRHRTLP